MRLVVSLFDPHAAYLERQRVGSYISNSAITGDDQSSFDTFTGLPWPLEDELAHKYDGFSKPLRTPRDIWSGLLESEYPVAASSVAADKATALVKAGLSAQAAEFTPGASSFTTSPKVSKRQLVSEVIQPVFAPYRTLDWRFGLIQVEYLEKPIEIAVSSPHRIMSPSRGFELPAIFEKKHQASALESKAPLPGDAGTIDLGYGIMHLYKEPQDDLPEDDDHAGRSRSFSNPEATAKRKPVKGDDGKGTMVAVLAVPSNWATADFLQFISDFVSSIQQVRIMRDVMPNRYMVLIKLHTSAEASRFVDTYDAKPYNDMLLDEICHVVRISAVEISTTDSAPYTFAFPQCGPEFGGTSKDKVVTKAGLNELPTCPVCLERMDASVSGLITVQCSHTFHCMCLKGWMNNNCPVCRYSSGRSRAEASLGIARPTQCAVCAAPDSLWMCLVCGHVGCGRFSGKHAEAHFEESGHTYAYELETQRVWDYAGDQYVHRLIQSKTDGKLVELPSTTSTASNQKAGPGPHGVASDEIAKIEAISIEFSDLMTIQLESQRLYYADRLAALKSELVKAEVGREQARKEAKAIQSKLDRQAAEEDVKQKASSAMHEELSLKLKHIEGDTLPEMERQRARLEKKVEKATDMARSMHKDLESERSVTKGLMDNITSLKSENTRRASEAEDLKRQITDLNEQVQDLMFTLTAQERVKEAGGSGGDVVVTQHVSGSSSSGQRRRRK